MFSRFKILIFQNEGELLSTVDLHLYFHWTLITCSCIVCFYGWEHCSVVCSFALFFSVVLFYKMQFRIFLFFFVSSPAKYIKTTAPNFTSSFATYFFFQCPRSSQHLLQHICTPGGGRRHSNTKLTGVIVVPFIGSRPASFKSSIFTGP